MPADRRKALIATFINRERGPTRSPGDLGARQNQRPPAGERSTRSGGGGLDEAWVKRIRKRNANLPYGAKAKTVSKYGTPQFSSGGVRKRRDNRPTLT